VAGLAGALAATVAIFSPAFLAMAAAGRSPAAFRRSQVTEAILAALRPVVVGTIAVAALTLGTASIHGWRDVLVTAGSLAALALFELPPVAVLLGAALIRAMTLLV
jgi:chromate transporter